MKKRIGLGFLLVLLFGSPPDLLGQGYPDSKQAIKSGLEAERLEAMKKRWAELIKKAPDKNPFFDFETERSKEIRKESGSEKDLAALLKGGLDMEILASVAFERNQALKAAKKEWESRLEAYSQVVQLEDILNRFSSFVRDVDTKAGPMPHQLSVKKRFPFPGAMTLKGDIVERDVRIAREKYNISLRDLISHLKQTFYEWNFVLEEMRITGENIALLKKLKSVAAIRFRGGKGGYNEVIKAQVGISKMNDDLATLREREKVIKGKILQYLDLPSHTGLGKPSAVKRGFIALSVEGLFHTALKNQQELRLIHEEIEKTRLAIELAEKKTYPDLSLGFAYFENRNGGRVGTGKTKEAFAEKKPFMKTRYWFGAKDAYIREARLQYQALLNRHESHKDKILYRIRRRYFALDKAKREILLYEKSLLALARQALDVSMSEYQSGKTDFMDVLDAQTTLLKFRLNHQRAVRDYGQALAGMEQVIGVSLAKR